MALALGGCPGRDDDERPNPIVKTDCPPLVEYSPEFQRVAAEQLPKAGNNVQVLVTDYGKLRNACRAIGRSGQRPAR